MKHLEPGVEVVLDLVREFDVDVVLELVREVDVDVA